MTSPAVKKLSLNTDDCEEDDDSLVNEDEENQLNEQSLSSSGVTSSSERSATGESSNQDAKELKEIIRSEEKAVLKTKAVLALAILCCAIAVTVAVYFLTLRNDLNRFEVEVSYTVVFERKEATVQYNCTVHYSTVQYSTVQYSAVAH